MYIIPILKARSVGISTSFSRIPLVLSFFQAARNHALEGRNLPVFIDCWSNCEDEYRDEILRALEHTGTFAGGVE